jgi:hypothetical protein
VRTVSRPTFVRFGVACLSVALVLGSIIPPALAAGTPLYPDLGVLPPRDLQLDRTDVSVDGSGQIHNVLRFSNAVINKGAGRLEMRARIDPTSKTGAAIERVYDDAGGFTDYTVGQFYYHPVHDHYHFDGWGLYQLWTKADYDKWIASGRTQGQAKKVGTKTTSCVIDEEFFASLPATPWPATYKAAGCQPDAQNLLFEGLSPGWADTYDYFRYEQWIDLDQETLTDGQWVLRSIADPGNAIYESPAKADASREGLADNEAITIFNVSGGRLVDSNPPSGTVSINHVDPTTASPNVTVQVLGRDDVSGLSTIRLSNDGTTWATFTYAAPGPSTAQNISWNLSDSRYGGTSAAGEKKVFAQVRDGAGTWSATFTDSITLAAPTGYAAVVAADSPVSHWRLGETAGTTAADATSRNSGTYEGGPALGAASLLTSSSTDRAVTFDGVNDDVRIPTSTSLGVSGALSIEAWIRPTRVPAAGAFASVLTKPESWSIQFNGPRLEFTVMQNSVRRRLQAAAGAVAAGSTYHVVGTYDGSTQRLYINGSQVASVALTGGASVTANDVRIASWNGAKEFFAGTVDEAAVYGSALSSARVAAHWTAGSGSGPSPTPSASASPSGPAPSTSTPPSAAPTPPPTPTPTPTPTPPPSAWQTAVTADGPTSWWRLDELDGTTLHDSAGTGNGAIWNSPLLNQSTLVPSDADPAMRFNGTSQYLAVPNSTALGFTTPFSLEAWIRPTALPAAGAFASVIAKVESYAIQFNGPRLEFTVMQSGVRRRLQAPSGAVVAGGTYHVVGTYDGTTQRLYLNGSLVASVALTGPATVTSNPVRIASWNGAKEFFAGTIDEVAVYKTALAAARVSAHWTAAGATATSGAAAAPAATSAPAKAPAAGAGAEPAPASATPSAGVTPTATPRTSPSVQPAPTPAPTPRPTTTASPSTTTTAPSSAPSPSPSGPPASPNPS